jgi:hypothetical protein
MLEKIIYSELNAKQKEIYNFQKVAALLADYGFNSIKLADDWAGADFLAYHKDGNQTLKVQLKGRLTIDKKYVDKDIWMTFPVEDEWYLIPHDDLISIIQTRTQWMSTDSWNEKGNYNSYAPSKQVVEALKSYRLGLIQRL